MTSLATNNAPQKLFTLPRAALELADFASDDEGRFALTHVLVDCDGGTKATVVATNGSMLARMVVDVVDVPRGRWMVPAALLGAARGKDVVAVDVFEHEVCSVKASGYGNRMPARVHREGNATGYIFPGYENVYPKPNDFKTSAGQTPIYSIDFALVADVAKCVERVQKLRGRGAASRGPQRVAIRFTSDTYAPATFTVAANVLPLAVVSLDFLVMPLREELKK